MMAEKEDEEIKKSFPAKILIFVFIGVIGLPALYFFILHGKYPVLTFGIMSIVIGLFFLVGAKEQWKFLVDPPEEIWWLYNVSFAKKFMGMNKKDLISYFYYGGIFAVLIGVFFVFKDLKNMF